ncbi:hypothetical protein AB5J62_15135 [Amycolatopsis sp. cg5]|uniref:hypothetical protein n=1 Tax=Amycolatopsis sp. cg5 TaxID=3238802 RepID=UPI003525E84B
MSYKVSDDSARLLQSSPQHKTAYGGDMDFWDNLEEWAGPARVVAAVINLVVALLRRRGQNR